MRQKELRIALVCYGGISLAVYMHGVTKEVWKLARASRDFHAGAAPGKGAEAVYRDLLHHIASEQGLHLRVLPERRSGGTWMVRLLGALHQPKPSSSATTGLMEPSSP